jgi:hypothetical protein
VHELLGGPLDLLAGDTATHLMSLAEVLLAAAILYEWKGAAAAALFAGSPIVVHLATIGYVDGALALFVAAGFCCLERSPALAGFFFGTACGVKYLGGSFAVAGVLLARRISFVLSCAAAALPTTLWLFLTTGNPVFPFLGSSAWSVPSTPVTWPVRLLWDVTFARERVNFQPPVTPLLIVMVILAVMRARRIALICAGYVLVFAFLPQDARYLVPLLVLLSAAAAPFVTKRWMVGLAVAPGAAYLVYRLAIGGLPPVTDAARQAWLARRIPEYTALQHTGRGTTFACGAEQLQYYAPGRFLGDVSGPYADRNPEAKLRSLDVDTYFVARRVCAPPRMNGLQLVYEDAAAQVWRVTRPSSR